MNNLWQEIQPLNNAIDLYVLKSKSVHNLCPVITADYTPGHLVSVSWSIAWVAVGFPVKAHTWIVGHVPGGQLVHVSLLHHCVVVVFSLSLKTNKYSLG